MPSDSSRTSILMTAATPAGTKRMRFCLRPQILVHTHQTPPQSGTHPLRWLHARPSLRRTPQRVCGAVEGLGFKVWGVGCGVWSLGFDVWGLWFGVWVQGFSKSVNMKNANNTRLLAMAMPWLWEYAPAEGKVGCVCSVALSVLQLCCVC